MSNFLGLVLSLSIAGSLLAQSDASLVSVEELRHPLTGRSLRTILAAKQHLKSGKHELGMQALREAMTDPMAMPYAISMLGIEHLTAGQVDIALGELEQAVRVLPRPENHSNLAYTLYLKGETERGLVHARKALQLDGGQPKTRLVLGMLLLQEGAHETEALQQLQAAAQESPSAHLVLAGHYDRAGQAPKAESERRAYAVTSQAFLAGK